MERTKPDVKQAILWTREACNVGVTPKTIVNCWHKTGILPAEDVEVVEQSSGNMISELAALLTEFAGSAVPDLMEILDVDCDVPTEAAELEEEVSAEPSDKSSGEEEQAEPKLVIVTLRKARDCMAKIAKFIQVNSASRGLARFVDVSMEMQSELDKNVATESHKQAVVTDFFKAVPKTTTISSPYSKSFSNNNT